MSDPDDTSPTSTRGTGRAQRRRRGSPPSRETEEERLNRNLGEMLQELRVAIPGVQILFAFLLAVPFAAGFDRTTTFQRDLYFATLLLTALAAALLMAPTAYHRMNFRHGRRRELIWLGNHFAIAGLGALAIAMTGAVTLVTDVLYGRLTTTVAASFALVTFAVLWFLIPFYGDRGDVPGED